MTEITEQVVCMLLYDENHDKYGILNTHMKLCFNWMIHANFTKILGSCIHNTPAYIKPLFKIMYKIISIVIRCLKT